MIRFEPGSKRNVPGGKKIAWNARNAGSKATANDQRQGERRRTDHAGGREHHRPDAPRLAAHAAPR